MEPHGSSVRHISQIIVTWFIHPLIIYVHDLLLLIGGLYKHLALTQSPYTNAELCLHCHIAACSDLFQSIIWADPHHQTRIHIVTINGYKAFFIFICSWSNICFTNLHILHLLFLFTMVFNIRSCLFCLVRFVVILCTHFKMCLK